MSDSHDFFSIRPNSYPFSILTKILSIDWSIQTDGRNMFDTDQTQTMTFGRGRLDVEKKLNIISYQSLIIHRIYYT